MDKKSITEGFHDLESLQFDDEHALMAFGLLEYETLSYSDVFPRDVSKRIDRGSGDSTRIYLNEIGRTPLLTEHQEIELNKIIQRGQCAHELKMLGYEHSYLDWAIEEHDKSKEHFIGANQRLVVSIAKKYKLPPDLTLLDLIQEGNLGLEHAVDKYDWKKGFKFSTYATYWVKQSVGRALDQKSGLIRVRNNETLQRLRQAPRGEIELTAEEIYNLNQRYQLSIDAPIGDGPDSIGTTYLSDEGDQPDIEDNILRLSLDFEQLFAGLSEFEVYAVRRRFGFIEGDFKAATHKVIGEEMGFTADVATRIFQSGLRKIKKNAEGLFPDNPLEN